MQTSLCSDLIMCLLVFLLAHQCIKYDFSNFLSYPFREPLQRLLSRLITSRKTSMHSLTFPNPFSVFLVDAVFHGQSSLSREVKSHADHAEVGICSISGRTVLYTNIPNQKGLQTVIRHYRSASCLCYCPPSQPGALSRLIPRVCFFCSLSRC